MEKLKLDSRNRRRVKQCPCGKNNRDGKFVPYLNEDEFGFCHSCGETFLPNRKREFNREQEIKIDPGPIPVHFIPDSFLIASLGFDNTFTDFLHSRFSPEQVGKVAKLYEVGTWQKDFGWPGWTNAVCFWQIDLHRKIRQVKSIRYDSSTGKRIKDGQSAYLLGSQLLKALKISEPNLKQCFFGEHLINDFPDKTIGVLESEKSAIIATIYIPEILWISTGGSFGCKWYEPENFKVLKDRRVILFPDNDKVDLWQTRAKENNLNTIAKISICTDFSQHKKTNQQTYDLADYLLKN